MTFSMSVRQQAFVLLGEGCSSRQVAARLGVVRQVVNNWRTHAGGVIPRQVVDSARYLGREERYELARLREAGHSVRWIAKRLGRSPSTLSRELRRNDASRDR